MDHTWVGFAYHVFDEVWKYFVAGAAGVGIGSFLPQVKLPFKKKKARTGQEEG